MWDIQVANLDITCAPNIPPCAKIEDYSAEQLRRIVVEAVRVRDSWTKGPSPSVRLERKQTITLKPAISKGSRLSPKFFPGGRFLVIVDGLTQLRVIDLQGVFGLVSCSASVLRAIQEK